MFRIKIFSATVSLLFVFVFSHCTYAQFTSGRLAVLRVGTGASALSSAGTAIFLDEYTTAGAAGITLTIPTTGAGRLVVSGTATSEGNITLSSDRNLITVSGYDTSAGFASVASSTSANVNRAIGVANSSASWSVVTSTGSTFSANNFRGSTSDGSNYWGVGGTSGVCSGTATGGSGLATVVSNTVTNIRSVSIYAGQLFFSTGSGSNRGIYWVGTGTPTSSSNTSVVYVNAGASASPYQFAFNSDTSICYIADDRASASGGVQRWDRSGSTWALSYTLGTGVSNIGARGLTVDWSGTNPVIYGTSAEASANRIFKITDTGGSSTATTLVTAATNTIFRGICFTPGSTNPLPVTLTGFNAQKKNGYTQLNWSTASEINNSHFEIEKQIPGAEWFNIGRVKGNGTSTFAHNYSFADVNTEADAACTLYRLKQVDFNGHYAYSNVAAACGSNKNTDIKISPNPVGASLQIELPAPAIDEVSNCTLIDAKGNSLLLPLVKDASGIYHANELNLQPGIYLLRLETAGSVYVKRICR